MRPATDYSTAKYDVDTLSKAQLVEIYKTPADIKAYLEKKLG